MHLISLIIGVIISSIGLMFIILYTNLITLGYSFLDFVKFIITRVECLLFLIGIIIILFSMKERIKNVLLLRYNRKFSRR
jgi:hypothetical protein